MQAGGTEERLTVGKTGEETRTTELQRELFDRYRRDRDYQKAQAMYRS